MAHALQAFVLPTCEAVPPYKTWIHVTRNCVSRETGQRMFYTGAGAGWVAVGRWGR
jgi:hypothetical protein